MDFISGSTCGWVLCSTQLEDARGLGVCKAQIRSELGDGKAMEQGGEKRQPRDLVSVAPPPPPRSIHMRVGS